MQIYLSKPGGEKQGPFTIEQIKAGQKAGLFGEGDYWAWHEGLTDWVPLYSVPGMSGVGQPQPNPSAQPLPAAGSKPAPAPTPAPREQAESAATPPVGHQLSSGLPFTALDHVFVLTTGDGPSLMHSEATLRILSEVMGTEAEAQHQRVPRDVISRCGWVADLRREGTVPEVAWRAMGSLRPELVAEARAGRYKVCVRTFPVAENDLVALFLFYNKQLVSANAQAPGGH